MSNTVENLPKINRERIKVSFVDEAYQPIMLTQGTYLPETLDATNSPLLFGCRTGICGTCLVEVKGKLLPPSDEEKELLDLYAPGNPKARLACQIAVVAPIQVKPLEVD